MSVTYIDEQQKEILKLQDKTLQQISEIKKRRNL